MADYESLRQKLRGPVYPVLPAFTAAGVLDLDATKQYVDALVERGAGVILVTAGTSRLNLLSFDEVAALNAAVAEACDGRALAIGGNPASGSTEATVELVRAAERAGADAFLTIYPERYYGDETVAGFFEDITRATDLAVLVHAIPMRLASTGPAQVQRYSLGLTEKLFGMPSIVGMKEEGGDEALRQRIVRRFDKEKPVILAGGGMRNYLASWGSGATTYLVGIGNFIPELEQRFHASLQSGDVETARRIVYETEIPFFDVAVPIGWHTALKATMALFGLMPPHERAPLRPPSAGEVEMLRTVAGKLGWKLPA